MFQKFKDLSFLDPHFSNTFPVVSHALSSVNMENQQHYHQKNDEVSVINFKNLSEITQGIGNSLFQMMKKNEAPKYLK